MEVAPMAAQLSVRSVTLLDDTLVNPIDTQNTILGMVPKSLPGQPLKGVQKLNVRIDLDDTGVDPSAVPAEVRFTVMSYEPRHRRPNKSSMHSPLTTSAQREGTTLSYKASVALSDLAPFMKSADSLLEVATVIRKGGTSAPKFRAPLTASGWAVRGITMQGGISPGKGRGPVEHEPDPMLLFQAGGVEVLEVAVLAAPGLKVGPNARAWAFVRSPADVFFYSGHGAWWSCKLVWDRGGNVDDRNNWADFLHPDDLVDFWSKQSDDILRSPMDLDVLIINGCGVLWWEPPPPPTPTTPDSIMPWTDTPCGPFWRRLLWCEEGPLIAILGYRDTAPLDAGGGDAVVQKMAQAMVSLKDNWDAYPMKWMQVNKDLGQKTWTAAAIDCKGYYYINKKEIRDSHTHQIRPLRGGPYLEKDEHGKKLKEGDIIGPVVMT
jgi:hypothetical protein